MTDLPLRCLCRKHAITSLRCARCFAPICPDCSRSAAVGMLCVSCVRGGRSHVYQAENKDYAKGAVAAFATALFGGWLLSTASGFGFFFLWFCFLYGLAVAEVTLRATGRKRGIPMEILVGAATGIGVVGGYVFGALVGGGDPTNALLDALRNPWSYVAVAIAVFSAVSRIRHW